MAAILIPVGEVVIEGGITIWHILFGATVVTGGAVVLHEATQEKVPATTETTTIVGTGKLDCGDNGSYEDLLKKSGDNKFDRDHVPSKAALKEAAQKIIDETPGLAEKLTDAGRKALFGSGSDPGLIAKQGQAIAIPKKDHQQHSDTYGRRNNPEKIDTDSDELQEAAKKDTKTIEDAEGKEMDDECLKKYQKAAEQIRKKTHAEYIKDLTKLIKDVIAKQ
ncbi:hypothetical protein [Collimonas sp. OK412]|jgi:hypothetical protein|uniref:hypothetical protein n=1 Tax=Collimonas sp. (strain OK412) TaxID=1801619 RepID=UPI0008F29498|nr:hypothetical protein [Collimonas sp. OK412]SFC29990.1 hypothetical protein SAMN04515619_106115 [Collimonas sp. OK412]